MDMGRFSSQRITITLKTSIMGFWSDKFITRSEDWVFAPLTADQVPDEPKTNDTVSNNEAYLSITLRSMRIVNVRQLTKKFYGLVHSFITLNHLSGADATFQTVTTPSELRKIDPKRLDRIVAANIPLLQYVPYRGGKVGLELGLFSVEEADLAGPFIDLLQTMASQAGVSVVSAALPFALPLKKGIDAILGSTDGTILETGVTTSFDPPKTGWWVVMRAPKGEINVNDLIVTPSDFRLLNYQTKQPIKNYPYIVLSITQSTERPDWFKVPDINKPYQELRAAVRKGDYNAAKELISTFRRAALTSDDLITKDSARIATLVKEETEAVMGQTLVSSGNKRELPSLDSYPLYSTNQ
jgi:hypothetical protein